MAQLSVTLSAKQGKNTSSSSLTEDSINFLRLCHIILDDIPAVLRSVFLSRFGPKYRHHWTDSPQSGQLLMKKEMWRSRLSPKQLQLLQDGNTAHWDPTILFHVLLHSSMCLLAAKVQGTQCDLQIQSKLIKATSPNFDFRNVLQSGDKIMLDLGTDLFRSVVTKVQKNQFFVRHPFGYPPGYQRQLMGQPGVAFDLYICQPEWKQIEHLSFLRNDYFAHCGEARTSAKELNSIIQSIEQVYINLRVPQKTIAAMKSIKNEPVASQDVMKMIQQYRDRWTIEHEHYQQLSQELTEVKTDVDDLMDKVNVIEEESIPQTQKMIKVASQELEEKTKEATVLSKEAFDAAENATTQIEQLSSKVSQFHNTTNVMVKEQGAAIGSHDKKIKKQDDQLESTHVQLSVMNIKQTNVASRVSYAIGELSYLSRDQKNSSQQLKETQENLASIHEVEKQLTDQVVQLAEHVTISEEETSRQVAGLGKQVNSLQLLMQETPSTDPLHCLRPSDFTADIKYYTVQHHIGTRKWLIDDIEQWLTQPPPPRNMNQAKICIVTGNPGMGKSVLAAKLCTAASDRGTLAACFFFQHHKSRRSNPNVLVKTLAYQLCKSVPPCKKIIEDVLDEKGIVQMKPVDLFTYLILEPLHQLKEAQDQKIMVIDGLDECVFEARNELLKLIIREFIKLPTWISVILTTRPDHKILQKLSKCKPVFQLDPDDPRNINDIKIYLLDVLKTRMHPEELESGIQLMTQKSEGMFLYFHYAAEAIFEKKALTLKNLETLLPDGIDDYYEQNFRRLFSTLGEEKYQLFFQAIAAARSNLPQQLVCPLLEIDQSGAKKITDTISVLLPIRNECITIFHKSVKDWLIDKDLAEDLVVDPTAGHSHMASVCYTEFKELKANAIHFKEVVRNPIKIYAIENLIYHLSRAYGRAQEMLQLCAVVTDMQYMYYRLHASQMSAKDLIDDLDEAEALVQAKSEFLKKLALAVNFVHRHAHIISMYPHLVFQCALNEPQTTSMQFGIAGYLNKPVSFFPGLQVYLELINKPHNFPPALTEYHCDKEITSFDKVSNGNIIACSDSNGKIYMWNKHSGELLCDPVDKNRSFPPISTCTFSPNGEEILIGDLTEAVGIDGSAIPLFDDENSIFNASIFSPNGDYILGWSYYMDGYFRLFAEIQMDLQITFCVRVWRRDKSFTKLLERTSNREIRPLCACFSHDSTSVVCGHRNGWIVIWEALSGKTKAMLSTDGTVIRSGPFKYPQPSKDDPLYDIAYTKNGHFMAACHHDGILIWDAAALHLIQKLKPSPSMSCAQTIFTGCSFSENSQHLAAGLSNGYVHVWVNQISEMQPFILQLANKPCNAPDAVTQCLFDNEQKNLICSVGSVIGVYSYQALFDNPIPDTMDAFHPSGANTSEFLSGGLLALTCGSGTIYIWDVEKGACIAKTEDPVSGHLVRLSSDKKSLLTYGAGCYIQLWDIITLCNKHTFSSMGESAPTAEDLADPDFSSPQDICHCAVSVQGVVVGGTGEGTIHIWYGKNYQQVKVIEDHEDLITYLEFSPDGNRFISADMEGHINMWLLTYDASKLHEQKISMKEHEDSIEHVVFSPGQLERVVSGGSDCMIHMYDGKSGNFIAKMEGHKSEIFKMSYSKCGRHLVTGDGKCQLILWDGITGQLIHRFSSTTNNVLLDLYFTGNDKYVCTLDVKRDQFMVHDVLSGLPVSIVGFSSPISTFAASSMVDGTKGYVICAMKDGSMKFLKLCIAL